MLRTALIAAALLFTGPVPAVAEPVGDRVEVNGMQMYYEVSGQGDPVIVLHGSYMNIPSMGAIIPKLAETHKVYALELQGHGRTTDIDRPITYANLADDVGRSSWTRWASRRPTCSAIRWAPSPGCSSPSDIRTR